MNKFHERLKKLRDESGKTQATIAKELKMTPQTFSYYVNGREPNYDTLISLAKYFDVSTDYLLGLPDDTKEIYITKGLDTYSNDELINELKKRMRG